MIATALVEGVPGTNTVQHSSGSNLQSRLKALQSNTVPTTSLTNVWVWISESGALSIA